MTKDQTEKTKKLIESMDFDETGNKIIQSMISLHSCISVELANNEIAPFFSDSKQSVKIFRRLYKGIDSILGNSDCYLYTFLERNAETPESIIAKILDFVTLLLKYPNCSKTEMNKAQVAYGLIEEYNLAKDIHRLAKELGREKPFQNIVGKTN